VKFWRTPLDVTKLKIPKGQLFIVKDRCKGCGFCVEYCPKGVLELSPEFNIKGYHPPFPVKEGECVDCELCQTICPEFAIYVVRKEEEDDEEEANQ